MPVREHIAGRATIFDKIDVLEEHIHATGRVYPTLADGVVVTGAGGAWVLGDFVEIIPVNTITTDFDIHFINIEGASAAGTYEIFLYAETIFIGHRRVSFVDIANSQTLPSISIQTRIIVKNSQIQAKIANAAGGGETITISLAYHPY